MARLTKKQKLKMLGKGICDIIHTGKPQGRKDGSVGTRPTVPCDDVKEDEVLTDVTTWLGMHRVFYDRNNTGSGDIRGDGHMYRYGIKDGGDIMGCLPDGTHFELELKRGRGGSWSEGQQKRCDKVKDNNGVYLLIHGVPELETMFLPLITRTKLRDFL
jgi:hypothetical protein